MAAAQRAQTRPQLMLTSNYTRLETTVLDDDEFWMVGLTVRWSLFDAGRNRNRVAAIRYEAQAAEHRLRGISADIELEVRGAWLDLQEADHRIHVAEAAVTQAEENLRVARDRYRSGANTNTEVLDAQALLEQALNNRDDTNFDTAIAKLRLARASGQL
jgi:outer membrane protein TolC